MPHLQDIKPEQNWDVCLPVNTFELTLEKSVVEIHHHG